MKIKKDWYWVCICGRAVKVLKDETKCKCKDYYEQDYMRKRIDKTRIKNGYLTYKQRPRKD